MSNRCPACERGYTRACEYIEQIAVVPELMRLHMSNVVCAVTLTGNQCDACGEISMDELQIEENQRRCKLARSRHFRSMTESAA